MNRRLGWKKLALLGTMSVIGLWASAMVLIIYNALHHQLPGCVVSTDSSSGIQIDCNKVLSSSYSTIFGIPLEAIAVGYFIVNLLLIYFVAFGSERLFRASFKTLFVWRFLGLCIVPYLITIELFIVKSICLYCTVMHASIIVDFAIISYFLYYKKALTPYLVDVGSVTAAKTHLPTQT